MTDLLKREDASDLIASVAIMGTFAVRLLALTLIEQITARHSVAGLDLPPDEQAVTRVLDVIFRGIADAATPRADGARE